MKKICFITTISLTIRAFVLPTIRYLHENTDWQIYVICDEDPELHLLLPEGVHYIPIQMQRGISLGGIKAMFQMIKVFRKKKFDLVQYSTPNASLYASLAAWVAAVPVRLYCQWGMAYVGFKGIKRSIFKKIEKLVCAMSTWIEPDSFGNLTFCHKEGLYPTSKGSVIWNGSASGVNIEKFDITHKSDWRKSIREQYGIGDHDFVYGFVGRITGDKGINELFTASKKILKENPNAWLMMVGNMEKTDSVDQTLFDWAQENTHVLFCGFTDVVEQYLAAMDVYVLPSYREGFGSVVIEAEAMGTPVIVTDIPGPTDAMIKDKTGILVPVKDSDALVQAMETVLHDPNLLTSFSQASYEFATRCFEQQKLMKYIMEDRKKLLERK